MTTKTTKTTTTRKSKPPVKLPANPFLFEVLDLVAKQRSNENKIKVLQEYKDPSIMAVMIWNYDPSIESALPPGDVPFADAKDIGAVGNSTNFSETINRQIETNELIESYGSNNRTTIRLEYEKFYNFLKGGNPSLAGIRRETMFINLLYGLHPREAEILCLVKDKRLQEKYKISFEIVKEAFPEIQWGKRT
jgi:hypothetical protein